MSYLVLARKWRPQTFEEIRGQAHIVRALRNAIASGRIAHAYLFTGIRGVGKTSAARVLAKALNCASGPTPTPCNSCPACREITEGKSPDVFEIDGASNTGVEDVRRLREAVRYSPVRGPYRIYIIDEVHMLSTAAFNALLKTLEEPPAHVVFIFATTDPHKIPVTILSRCQQFDFKRLSTRELMGLLGDVALAEGIEVDEKSLLALAREAEGSVRDAQSLLDQVISYAGQRVTYEETRDVLGVVDRDLLMAVARDVVSRNPRGAVERLAEAERFGYDARRLAYDLMDVFRDLAVLLAVEGGDDLVDLAPEEVNAARGFLDGLSWEEAHALFDMLARGVETLRTASRPGSVLEMTLLKMAKLPPILPLSEVLARVRGEGGAPGGDERRGPAVAGDGAGSGSGREAREAVRRLLGDAPKPPRRDPPKGAPGEARGPAAEGAGPERDETQKPASAEGALSPDEGSSAGPPEAGGPPPSSAAEFWSALMGEAERTNRPIWSVLREHGSLVSWDPQGLHAVVGIDDPSHAFFLNSRADVLSGLLRRLAGAAARVEIRSGEAARPARGGARETDRVRGVKREALEHPLVREAVELFEGDVEEVRVLRQ